jgi:hypothetical protein
MTRILPSGFSDSYLRSASSSWLLNRLRIEALSLARKAEELSLVYDHPAEAAARLRPGRIAHLKETIPMAPVSLTALSDELASRGVLTVYREDIGRLVGAIAPVERARLHDMRKTVEEAALRELTSQLSEPRPPDQHEAVVERRPGLVR